MQQLVKVNHKEFWHVRFSSKVLEWRVITEKLRDSIDVKHWNDWIMTQTDSGDVEYLFYKERYTAALMAKTYGVDEEVFKGLEVLILDDPNPKDLPSPTVGGWGTA